MNERYIKLLIFFAATVWAIVLLLSHKTIQPGFLKPLSTVMTASVYAALAFDRWMWKWPIIRLWIKRPAIEGTWHVSIQSNWKDPNTNERLPLVEGFMVVRQTLSTLSMRLLTKESSSALIGTEIVCAPDGLYFVTGVYRNEPRLAVRERSAIHNGAILLQVESDTTGERLSGHYWTDRVPQTSGEMILFDREKVTFGSYAAAASHFLTMSQANRNQH